MAVAPGEQSPEHRAEVAAALGQQVFVAWRPFAVAASLEQPRLNERVEPPGQRGRGDVQAFLELLEAGRAEKGVPQQQDAPPLADPVQAARDWALHGLEACVAHGSGTLTIITIVMRRSLP